MKEIRNLIVKEIARLEYYVKSNEERKNKRRVNELKNDIAKLEKMLLLF